MICGSSAYEGIRMGPHPKQLATGPCTRTPIHRGLETRAAGLWLRETDNRYGFRRRISGWEAGQQGKSASDGYRDSESVRVREKAVGKDWVRDTEARSFNRHGGCVRKSPGKQAKINK